MEFTTKRQKMEQPSSTERKDLFLSTMKMETNITDLPVEILSKIFKNISTTDLLQNVALVSKCFYQVTKTPQSHRCISMTIRTNLKKAKLFLEQATLIESLFIKIEAKKCHLNGGKIKNEKQTKHLLDPLLEPLAKHHQLQHLEIISLDLGSWSLHGPKYIPANGIITRNCIAKLGQSTWWPKLKTLILPITNEPQNCANSKAVDVLFAEALNLLSSSGNLCRLSIAGLSRAEEGGLIMSSRDLKSLRINKCFKYSEVIPFLLKIQSTVEELDLGNNFYGQRLFPFISKFTNLKSFKQSLSLPYAINMYQQDENESLDVYREDDYDIEDDEILPNKYWWDKIYAQPPFHSFRNLKHLTSIQATIHEWDMYAKQRPNIVMPNVIELKVCAFSEDMNSNVVTDLANMFPNLETYWFVSDAFLQVHEENFAALFQTPRKLKDFRLTEKTKSCLPRGESVLGLKKLLSNIGQQWPQLNCFLWGVDTRLEKHLFSCARTLHAKLENLEVIGTNKTLFVKPLVKKGEILSLAGYDKYYHVEIV